MTPIATQAMNLLAQLATPAARALAVAAAAGVAIAAFRVRSAALQLLTWTAVLYVALVMPLLAWVLPPLPIHAPAALYQSMNTSPRFPVNENAYVGTAAPGCPVQQSSTCSSAGTTKPPRFTHAARSSNDLSLTPQLHTSSAVESVSKLVAKPALFPWPDVLAALYLTGAFLLLGRFFIGLVLNRRLLRSATTVDYRRFNASDGPVRLAQSEFVRVPITLGILRPTILLPSTWPTWDEAKLDAVIAHEMSHVARRDALTQRLSLLHRAIFWFSPLAWWLDHRLADLAEQASDEAALAGGVDRKQYARILLEFFETLHAAPGRVRWIGVSMAKAGQAEQRVERILTWKGTVAMHLRKSIAVAVIALAVPVVYVAASAFPAHRVVSPAIAPQIMVPPSVAAPVGHSAQNQDPFPQAAAANAPKAYPTPSVTPDAAPVVEPDAQAEPALAPTATGSGVSVGVVAPVARVAAIAPLASAGYRYHIQQDTNHSTGNGSSYSSHYTQDAGRSMGKGSSYSRHFNYDDEQRFVIVTGNSDSLTMSGSIEDARHVEKLRKSIGGDFIWFERDEKSYVIRDQATVDGARKLFAPEEELGKKQEALGEQQEALGKQQEALGAKMEQVQVKVPDMTAALDSLKAKLQKLGPTATMDQIGDLQSEIGELQSKIGDIQSQAGDQQGKLGEQMGALGEKQGKLGEQQGELGEQQAKLAHEANQKIRSLFDEAIKSGTAQPEL